MHCKIINAVLAMESVRLVHLLIFVLNVLILNIEMVHLIVIVIKVILIIYKYNII